jgi:hypothetical protein
MKNYQPEFTLFTSILNAVKDAFKNEEEDKTMN